FRSPIYAVHYNKAAANAMGVAFQYDVGFQRQCWQIHLLTNWCGDNGWVKHVTAEYRGFVYLSDVIDLGGTVVGKSVDESGEHVVQVETFARNQRGDNVMPGTAVVALPTRSGAPSPVAARARRSGARTTFAPRCEPRCGDAWTSTSTCGLTWSKTVARPESTRPCGER